MFTPFAFVKSATQAVVPSAISQISSSRALYAYYDVAFTSSYSASNQATIYSIAGGGINGTVSGTMTYTSSADVSGSYIQHTATSSNYISLPNILSNGQGYSVLVAFYYSSSKSSFDSIVVDRNGGGATGLFSDTSKNIYAYSVEAGTTVANALLTGSWNILQYSVSSSAGISMLYNLNNITGSYATTNLPATASWYYNRDTFDLARAVGGNFQVLAIYTGSLSQQEML